MSVVAENSQKKQQKKAEEHPQPFLYTMQFALLNLKQKFRIELFQIRNDAKIIAGLEQLPPCHIREKFFTTIERFFCVSIS